MNDCIKITTLKSSILIPTIKKQIKSFNEEYRLTIKDKLTT